MKLEFEKKMHLISELLSYCHLKGALEYHFDMVDGGNITTITMNASPVELDAEDIELLKTYLTAPRRRDMEQEYWNLSGESEDSTELRLIGMMCDEAEIEYSGRHLKFILERNI